MQVIIDLRRPFHGKTINRVAKFRLFSYRKAKRMKVSLKVTVIFIQHIGIFFCL